MKFLDIDGSLRVKEVEETLEKARQVYQKCGITRIADISTLSKPGGKIYTMSAIRPNAYVQQMSNGKGTTKKNSTASAVMETIELMHSETLCGLDYTCDSAENLRKEGRIVNTIRDILPEDIHKIMLDLDVAKMPYLNAMKYTMNKNSELETQECYIPAATCIFQVYPYTNRTVSTNGLSSGNSREEAMIHGLLEVIERDSLSLESNARLLDIKENEKSVQIQEIEKAGLEYQLKYYCHPTDIPVIGCTIFDRNATTRINAITEGWGCHKNKNIALSRAVTEAVQGKTVSSQGAREDLEEVRKKIKYDDIYNIKEIIENRRAQDERKEITKYTDISIQEVRQEDHEELDDLMRNILRTSSNEITSVNLTRREIGINVTKCFVKGYKRGHK